MSDQPTQVPATPPGDDELAKAKAALAAKEAELTKAQREAKRLQSRADSLEARLQRKAVSGSDVNVPTPSGGVRPSGGSGGQTPTGSVGNEELTELMEQQAKELALLRELTRRGLTADDIEDLTFETTGELSLKLDLIQQKKDIEQLRSQLEQQKQQPGGSEVRVDTGGRTSLVVAPEVTDKVKKLRQQASDLKGKRMHKEATWVALRAAHADPTKILGRSGEEE